MQMTENEIRRTYEQAKNKREQITILADLNCCSKAEIKKILGIEQHKPKPKEPDTSTVHERIAYMDRLDELDAMIKPLEDEYKLTAAALMKIGG